MPNYTFIAETARKLERKAENGKAFPTVHIFYVKFKDLPGSKDDVNKNFEGNFLRLLVQIWVFYGCI